MKKNWVFLSFINEFFPRTRISPFDFDEFQFFHPKLRNFESLTKEIKQFLQCWSPRQQQPKLYECPRPMSSELSSRLTRFWAQNWIETKKSGRVTLFGCLFTNSAKQASLEVEGVLKHFNLTQELCLFFIPFHSLYLRRADAWWVFFFFRFFPSPHHYAMSIWVDILLRRRRQRWRKEEKNGEVWMRKVIKRYLVILFSTITTFQGGKHDRGWGWSHEIMMELGSMFSHPFHLQKCHFYQF